MDAKNGLLNPVDIVKIYLRKFFRLAPAYYSMWMIIWALTSRLADGKTWDRANINNETCSQTWRDTLYMISNLNTTEMKPLAGCYQQAWPLQVDMQLHLIIPFVAMFYWISPILGSILSLALIAINGYINVKIASKYDLKIGWIDVHQYYILMALISKPWTKL